MVGTRIGGDKPRADILVPCALNLPRGKNPVGVTIDQ
jgi:hypothetical protein